MPAIFSALPSFQTLMSALSRQQESDAATRWASQDHTMDALDDPLDPGMSGAMFGMGVANPHGKGASAFEPNTISLAPELHSTSVQGIFDTYASAYERRRAEREAAQSRAESQNDMSNPSGTVHQAVNGIGNGPMATGSGVAFDAIKWAKTMLGTWYVWGGADSSGVDCSGLIYYAFNKAGFSIPRYRAVDYGTRVGHSVPMSQARPGDIVYFDNPGDVDHVGIYLGNNQFIEAPNTGEKVQISSLSGRNPTSIRRILPDSAWR